MSVNTDTMAIMSGAGEIFTVSFVVYPVTAVLRKSSEILLVASIRKEGGWGGGRKNKHK